MAANVDHAHKFTRTCAQLYKLADLKGVAFKKALDGLQRRGLIFVRENESTKQFVHLCYPFTGEPMLTTAGDDESDPANYFTTDAYGSTQRLNLNTGNVEERNKLIYESVKQGDPVIPQSNGDLRIRCPFHDDTTPSCSVSSEKSCFYCFACHKRGTLTQLIAKLTGVSIGSAIKRRAEAIGMTAEFHQPDSKAIANYDYIDEKGKLKKRVLRFPDDDNGNKIFSQRRWKAGTWIPDAKGLGPMLYNAEWLKFAEYRDTYRRREGRQVHHRSFPDGPTGCGYRND